MILQDHLEQGHYIYGVNTGFGGNADSRTTKVIPLQSALMQLAQAGILSDVSKGGKPDHSMPSSWVRAAIVVRINTNMRGHSAIRLSTLEAVLALLQRHITPVVPLRGSVSASGDLMPLSYIAGAVVGNPDIMVEREDGSVSPADEALAKEGLEPITFGPKECLALINGTASSAALGALVMFEAHQLAVLTQALTAVTVEALSGSVESFHPFIAEIRPHGGQVECSANMLHFLRGSKLARDNLTPKDSRVKGLVQDRYSIRTVPQWIGPQLEDLLLADKQISTELNSTSDNPIVDAPANDVLCGGNFQATSVTSAMEKTRLALQMFGRLLFSQVTEMVNPNLSHGLPANLVADDASLSFTMKGVEIAMASYMAELSYVTNPMSSHVQPAEMHNQSVNSMALASARMSMESIDLLRLMCACSLYAGCQALDLRVLHQTFLQKAIEEIQQVSANWLVKHGPFPVVELNEALEALRHHIPDAWKTTGKLDMKERCEALVTLCLPIMVDFAAKMDILPYWRGQANRAVWKAWNTTSEQFLQQQNTVEYLGVASKSLYLTVRRDLKVPFHTGFVEQPAVDSKTLGNREKRTVGGWISIIYDALKDGRAYDPLMKQIREDLARAERAMRDDFSDWD
jgi:phenylalanine ammonia-lyase